MHQNLHQIKILHQKCTQKNQTKIRMRDYVHSLFRSIKSPCLVYTRQGDLTKMVNHHLLSH